MARESDKQTIAVIDGDTSVRALAVRTFESLGHRVVESGTSQGLVENLAGIDGLVIDPLVGMENPPARFDLGLELLLRLRRQSPTLAIAVMSADTRVDVVVKTMRLGVRDYLAKPVDKARLVVAATRLLEAHGHPDPAAGITVLPSFSEIEKQLIERALQWNRGQVARTARMLGIGRATLYRKLGEMGHPLPRGGRRRPA